MLITTQLAICLLFLKSKFSAVNLKKTSIILAILFPIQVLIIQGLSNYSEAIENYYSNGIYPYISQLLRIILGWIPFSFGDVLLFMLIFTGLRFLVLLIKKRFRNLIPKTINIAAFFSIIHFFFYLFWGLNYFRKPLSENLSYTQKKYSNKELTNTIDKIVKELNSCQLKITKNDTIKVAPPLKIEEMYDVALASYENLAKKYPKLKYKHKSMKNSFMSLLQTYNGTTGYINPITGEAQINKRVPKTSLPTTICHEMSHQIGYAAENEANFIGFLAANFSKNIYFKYSSYRMAFGYCIRELGKRNPEQAKIIWKKVNQGVIKDYKASYRFWKSYENPFEPWVKRGYNAYLKANNQTKGSAYYNYVVDLLISYFKDLSKSNI